MTRLHGLLSLSLVLSLSACAPLHPHESAWGDTVEVVGRVLVCPVTLCTSELILHMEHKAEMDRLAYGQWYRSLPPEQQDREDRREAVRLNALGMALMGGGPNFVVPQTAPMPAPRSPFVTCTSQTIGTQTYLNCP